MGTLKSLVENMVKGVTKGYSYKMKIAYSIILFLAAFIPGLIIIKLQKPLKFDLKYLLVFAGAFIFSITILSARNMFENFKK